MIDFIPGFLTCLVLMPISASFSVALFRSPKGRRRVNSSSGICICTIIVHLLYLFLCSLLMVIVAKFPNVLSVSSILFAAAGGPLVPFVIPKGKIFIRYFGRREEA